MTDERYFPTGKRCCARRLKLASVQEEKENGNGGRRYYKCFDCDKFYWNDYRGIHENNHRCHCQLPSRLGAESVWDNDGTENWQLVYRCQDSSCHFKKLSQRRPCDASSVARKVVRGLI